MTHHIRSGLGLVEGSEEVPERAKAWISHWPGVEFRSDNNMDSIVWQTWIVVGSTRLKSRFLKELAAEDWWPAYCACTGWLMVFCVLEGGMALLMGGKLNDTYEQYCRVLLRLLKEVMNE